MMKSAQELLLTDTVARADKARPLFIPALGRLYASLHDSSETILRVAAGGALIVHGAAKIGDPMGNIAMVEGLGFYPGVFWSPLLAITEFFGGMLIVLGLFTRPASFAAMIVLLVTVWFHWITLGQGFSGAEKSILWAAIFLFFAVRGANKHSIDARIGKEF